ncbi:MAG: aminodeoxychorismate synthase component I [Bacteroidetes bacterium]|nr:aminodeoxychorismate synthase component I [Bacteroidota bacterium]
MMKAHSLSDKNTAIRLMNSYGSQKKPFLFIVDFMAEHSIIQPLIDLDPEMLQFCIHGFGNGQPFDAGTGKKMTFSKFPVTFESYAFQYDKVAREIEYGNSYLLNLTCPTPIAVNLDLHEIFDRSDAPYKLWFNNRFVVFSPETFIRIENGKISSFPMKGTIDASLPDAEQKLLSDPKELAEHYTIVDLIRNDLGGVASQVKVEEFRYIGRIETNYGALLQASSRITGILPDNYRENLGSILFRILPAGSISGAPKERTLQIIRETETYDRGFYTGVFGYFDGNNLDSGVMIRFIESTPEGMIFKSGGGITSFSEAEKEYREMIAKVYVPFT